MLVFLRAEALFRYAGINDLLQNIGAPNRLPDPPIKLHSEGPTRVGPLYVFEERGVETYSIFWRGPGSISAITYNEGVQAATLGGLSKKKPRL